MRNNITLGYYRMFNDVKTPSYGTESSACMDVYYYGKKMILGLGQVAKLNTGLKFVIPDGYCMKLYIRSGISVKGLSLTNGVGVIDQDYRGELIIPVISNNRSLLIHDDMRIAQVTLEKTPRILLRELPHDDFDINPHGGFGSTG